MRAGNEKMLDGVCFFALEAGDPLATASLGFIDRGRQTLDVALVRDCDHHGFLSDEVFHVVVAEFFAGDLRHAIVAVLAGDLDQIVADDCIDVCGVAQDRAVLLDFTQDF